MKAKSLLLIIATIVIVTIHICLFIFQKKKLENNIIPSSSGNNLSEVVIKEPDVTSGGDPETDHRHQIYLIEEDSTISRYDHPRMPNMESNIVISFKGKIFVSPGEINEYHFNSSVNFNECTFIPIDEYISSVDKDESNTDLQSVTDVDMLEVKNNKENYEQFRFSNLTCKGFLQFSDNKFQSDINLDHCHFLKFVFFENNTFKKTSLNFMKNRFENGVKISGKSMYFFSQELDSLSSISFSNDTIYGRLDLSNLSNEVLVSFSNSFIDTLDLSFVNSDSGIDLRYSSLDFSKQKRSWANNPLLNFFLSPYINPYKEHITYLNLIGTNISMIDLDYTNFRVYFPKTSSANERSAVYQGLLTKYRNNGEMENYKKADVEYHNEQGGVFNFVSWLWWNYGYSKWLVFVWSLFFLSLFSIINYRKIDFILESYKIRSVENWLRAKYNGDSYRGRYAFIASFLYTGAIFFSVKLDFEKFEFSKLNYSFFILFQFLLGLVCTGFIVSIIVSK
ncbi:MAG: hypothetical protein J0I32_09045 [Sphingobacteriales bacterium]|nr:hypothetical protein [Sphingobacteriales bacterium]